MSLETEFLKLQSQTDYVKNIEPMKYSCLLFLGTFCLCFSSYLLIIELTDLLDLSKGYGSGIDSQHGPVNTLLKVCMENGLELICNVIFTLIATYMIICALKGNQVIGYRLSSAMFYPMQENETQFNAFIANIQVLNSITFGITLWATEKLEQYTYFSYVR